MTLLSDKRRLAGPGYKILNVLRACNIISLLAAVAASFVMLVKTIAISKFFLFDGVSHLITAVVAGGLIITETNLFRRHIARCWPLLGPAHGFVLLGLMMMTLGISILGNLNKEATSQKSLGTPMWRCVISSGILCLIFAVLNIFSSFIFRDKEFEVTARMIRAYGLTAYQKTSPYVTPTPSVKPRKGYRSFFLGRNKAEPALPTHHSRSNSSASARNFSTPPPGNGRDGLGMGYYGEKPYPMSHEDAANGREGGVHCPPVVDGIQRPDLAHHPAYANVRRIPSSVYTR